MPTVGLRRFVGNDPAESILVAESRGWKLFDRGDDAGLAWRRFKLVAMVFQAKANFHLAFNGDRFAMGRDAQLLSDHFPDTFAWAENLARAACHGDV